METNNNYHKSEDIKNIQKMRQVLNELPKFCGRFFKYMENYTSARTRLAYAYDLRLFFEFTPKNGYFVAQLYVEARKITY